MKKLILITVLGAMMIFNSSCKKDEIPETLPQCVQDKISDFIENNVCSEGDVTSYDFQGGKVYVLNFDLCIADGGSQVIDEDCNEICFLGGIAGLTECNGEEFGEVAINPEVVWEQD